jgi:hypothetical protein
MKGLYNEIELALNTLIEGLNYSFIDGDTLDEIDPEKMKTLASAKTSALLGAKKIIDKWIDSPNKPSDTKIKSYIDKIVKAGNSSVEVLRKALSKEIDFKGVEAHKHTAALMSKPIILEAIFDIDNSMKELRDKLESGDLTFKEKEFRLGYPELYGKGEFTRGVVYHKKRLNDDGDVLLDPLCSEGERIVIDDLGIILPEVPKNKKDILYYNHKKADQYWRRAQLPNITTSSVDNYHEFILEEFRRRREGVWFYNMGKPTYLTGSHYFALQYCKMIDDGGYMDFRISQQKLFYFMDACIIDNRSLGMLFGKGRRTGFTYCAITQVLNRATTTKNTKHGLMSKSGTDAEEAFAKESYMFLNLPFWFRPVVKGKLDSPKELYFGQPSDNSKQTKQTKNINMDEYLNTSMDWRNTKNGSYDSIKLDTYILDEIFKIESPNDVIVHLSMVAPTMMPNGRVVGKMLAGSTMGLFKKGGEQGLELILGSLLSTRDESTKKTITGLYFHFLPAHENMEEFTDRYGKCWINKPEKPVVNVFGDPITEGALNYLLAIEAQKKKQSDTAYNEQIRTYPRSLDHLMRDDSKECVFNMEKIYEQLDFNKTLSQEELYTVGNFEWEDIKDGKVEFRPRSDGRFKIAWMPSVADGTEALQNRVKEVNGKYFPLNTECVRFGCDPYSYKSTHGKGSKGGLHGKTIFLPEGGAPSNKFVLEYLARPTDDTVFFEDIIKCVKFYGAPILVESNRLDLLRHMNNRGYRGFAMNRLDRVKLNDNEKKYGGQMMSGKDILDSHMSSIGTWVENYVGNYTDEEKLVRPLGEMGSMPFTETLQDWLRFDPDKRTEYDATISSGLAIMACQKDKYRGKKVEKKKIDLSTILTRYSTKGNIGSKLT